MVAPVNSISLDVSVEIVGSSFTRHILIDSSSVKVPITPKVGAATVASPVGVLELDTYSSLKADPSESSQPPVSIAPMIPAGPILPTPFVIVAPSSEFPITPVVAPPRIRRQRAILIRPREDIPFGQIYCTHPGRPCRVLIVRKSVRPLPFYRLALRYTSHHLDHFTSGSSSGHSSLDHSSSGHFVSGHSLYGHTPLDTTITDSSTPLTTSESSAGDSFFKSSHRPSRKRCRSPAAIVTSSIHATRALVPSRTNLLLSCKRFRDFISPKDSKEDIDTDVLEDIEANAKAVEVAVVRDVVAEVDACIDMEVDAVKHETFFGKTIFM
nr:hypothetical protein [Tanacetum cinerariifolium]